MNDTRWDAIVVGSGLGGMTAAAYLAATGSRTLLLEQYSVLGGNSHVFRRKQFEFEVGLHYVGDCGEDGNVPTILGGLGLADKVGWERMGPDVYDTIMFPDLTFDVPYGWDNYLANLIEAFPDEEKPLRSVVGVMSAVGTRAHRVKTPGSVRGMAGFAARGPIAATWALQPLQRLFGFYGLSERAQSVIAAQWGQHGCPPHRAPVSLHAGLLHNYIEGGAYFPHGGSQVLAGRLAQVILANGGSIRTSARVERIVVESGRVTGVDLVGGEHFDAPVVISNADIKKTYLDMVGVEHLQRSRVRKVDGYRMSVPFVNVYLGLDIDLRESMPNRNYFVFPHWDIGQSLFDELVDKADVHSTEQWMEIAEEKLMGFVHSATVKDPTHDYAPPGGSALEVMTLVPESYKFWGIDQGPADGGKYRKNTHYLDVKDQITDLLVRRAIEAVPQAAGHIVWQESATPITQERYTLATGGSAYGIECNTRQFGPFRPTARTDIKGLYLAGATTAWGPSIEGAAISGLQAASAVTGRNLFNEIRGGAVLGDTDALPSDGANWDPLRASKNYRPRERQK